MKGGGERCVLCIDDFGGEEIDQRTPGRSSLSIRGAIIPVRVLGNKNKNKQTTVLCACDRF